MLRVRFRVYAPNGALIGALPYPASWELGIPLNDMPSLRLDYHPDAPGASVLNAPCEVALEIQDPETGEYSEYPGCRFLNLRNSGDRLDRSGLVQYQMPSYGWQLRKVRNIDFDSFNEDGQRVWTTASPGEILAALINESKSRGNIPQLAIDFDGEEDSNGEEWEFSLNLTVDAGQDVWGLLDAFTRQGLCDWRMNGRTLQVYNPDGFLNRDLTADPAIVLRPFIDHTNEPNDASIEDLEFKALVQGDENAFLEVENPTALSPWGEWEGFITQSGVTDATTMELLAMYVLQGKSNVRVQMTRQLVFRDGRPLPLVNYRPGDHVLSTDEDGNQTTDLRVFQITLSSADERTVQGHITLNDRFIERDLRNQRAINNLTGVGGPGSTGGTGGWVKTPPPSTDTSQPAAPTGVGANSSTYINELGEPIGQATVTWNLVTESTGGSPIDVDSYEVQSRLQTLPEGFETRTFVADPQSVAFVGPLDVGRTYVFRVRARARNGRSGPWSSTVSVLIQADDEAPPAPSVPILSSRLGTIRVTWDGLDDDGNVMPLDLREVQVEMSETGAGPWEMVGTVFAQGSVIITDLPYEATRFFRFLAVDTSGNQSDPSAVASIEVVRVEGPDIEANSITTNHLTAGSVTAEKVAAYSLTADRLAIGAMRNIVADGNLGDAELSAHRVEVSNGLPNSASNIVWTWTGTAMRSTLTSAATNSFGRVALVNSTLLDTDLAVGETLPSAYYGTSVDPEMGNVIGRMGANIFLDSGTWPAGGQVLLSLWARFYDGDGNNIGPSTTVAEQTFTAPTGGIITMQSVTGSVVPSNAVSVIMYPRVNYVDVSTTNVIVEFSTIFASQAFGEVLIENGAISAPKIQANAITTTQLDADAITAKQTITGSFIQTATGGIRVTMGPNANFLNQPGIRLWSNNNANHTANIFVADTAGTGDWDPQSFVIVGPENVRNSSGRADLNLQMGGGFFLEKHFVTDNTRRSGIYGPNDSSELQLQGSAPRGDATNDVYGLFRTMSIQFGSEAGSITWGADIGWVYRTQATVYNSSSTAAARYVSIRARSTSGFGYIASGTSAAIETLSIRGGYILG